MKSQKVSDNVAVTGFGAARGTPVKMSRPEISAPPQEFYNDNEAHKYTSSSRVIEIQDRLTERAVELLNFPKDDLPRLLLDVGCGSGLSGDRLTELGYSWIGMDISKSMLQVAQDRTIEGGVIQYDMGHGCPFRPGIFDGCVSISAVQWLCNADHLQQEPRKRLNTFFSQLYRCLKRGAKAVLQFYPDGAKQAELITTAALRVGFSGGLVVDYPNSTRAKKYFLVLVAGCLDGISTSSTILARFESSEADAFKSVRVDRRSKASYEGKKLSMGQRLKAHSGHKHPKGKAWILKKKQQARCRGQEISQDSKYTGRKRKDRL